jgi:cytochrome c oxidase cbb3-type subunit 1
MWREYGPDGYLVYAFSEVVTAMHPMYLIRAAGGLMYLAGALIMVWNIVQTIRGRLREEKPLSDARHDPARDRPLPGPGAAAAWPAAGMAKPAAAAAE